MTVQQAVEAREAGARLGVVVGGEVVEAVALREGEQPAMRLGEYAVDVAGDLAG